MPFLTTEQIGEKRSTTPEGFLICHDVPLARTGEQLYRPEEVPVKPRPGTDYIRVMRDADEVFRPEALLSAEGKPFVINHPDGMQVTPKLYRQLARGHVQNVRRGDGADADVILGDIVVMDQEAIDLISRGMREISMGYDCGYQELGEDADLPSGLARQHDIVFNHVALVDQGRCGPRCAIGDHTECDEPAPTTENDAMATTRTNDKRTVMDRLRAFIKTGDESKVEAVLGSLDDVGDDDRTIVINNHTADRRAGDEGEAPPWFKEHEKKTEDRFKSLDEEIKKIAKDRRGKDADPDDKDKKTDDEPSEREEMAARIKEQEKEKAKDEAILGQLEMEAPPGTGDSIRTANDSALLEDSFSRLIADAEVLAPGIRVPTYDGKAKPRATFDAMCNLRRSALGFAMNVPETAGMIESANGGRTIDTKAADCGAVRTVFNAAVALKKAANNADSTRGASRVGDGAGKANDKLPRTIADLNRINAERHGRKVA